MRSDALCGAFKKMSNTTIKIIIAKCKTIQSVSLFCNAAKFAHTVIYWSSISLTFSCDAYSFIGQSSPNFAMLQIVSGLLHLHECEWETVDSRNPICKESFRMKNDISLFYQIFHTFLTALTKRREILWDTLPQLACNYILALVKVAHMNWLFAYQKKKSSFFFIIVL